MAHLLPPLATARGCFLHFNGVCADRLPFGALALRGVLQRNLQRLVCIANRPLRMLIGDL